MATYTPDNGSSNPQYIAVEITISCEVTSFAVSNAPSTQTYNVFDALKTIDLTGVTYTQDPPCGYTYTSAYTVSSSPSSSWITAGTVLVPSVTVYSADGNDEGSITVSVDNAVTIDSAQG